MKTSKRPLIKARKQPKQARATQLVADILEAAIRVLTREGAARFTTVRVAEEAGVSIGSLYQYFPNKQALLFRLQADEWQDTSRILLEQLGEPTMPTLERLRRTVLIFFRSEQEEAPLRIALDDAGALFRDAPEARRLGAVTRRCLLAFMKETLPEATARDHAFAADFVGTSMGAVAEKVTAQGRSRAEVDAWARASAEMYCAFLRSLGAVD